MFDADRAFFGGLSACVWLHLVFSAKRGTGAGAQGTRAKDAAVGFQAAPDAESTE